jgi:hypothetical protein
MAKPPELLQDVLPRAAAVVMAEVLEATGGDLPPSSGTHQPVGSAAPLPEQRVRLKVTETLHGAPCAEINAIKPAGSYWLVRGNHGPFLLDSSEPPNILGRFGPDTYPAAFLRNALAPKDTP